MAVPVDAAVPQLDPVAAAAMGAELLDADPGPVYHYWHHPDAVGSWELETKGLDEPTWLPRLDREYIVPGVNGYRTVPESGNPKEAFENAHIKRLKQGGIMVPHDVGVGGVDRYVTWKRVRNEETRVEGMVYYDVWERPQRALAGRRVTFAFDRAAYNRWRLALITETDLIPPPNPRVIKLAIADRQRALTRNEVLPLPEDVRARRVKEKADALEVAENAKVPGTEAVKDGAPPKGRRGGRGA